MIDNLVHTEIPIRNNFLEADLNYYASIHNHPKVLIARNITALYSNPSTLFNPEQYSELAKTLRLQDADNRPILGIPFNRLGDAITATHVAHVVNDALGNKFNIVTLPEKYAYLSPFTNLYLHTRYHEQTISVLPIQEIYFQELRCIYPEIQETTIKQRPLELHSMTYKNDELDPETIIQKGTEIAATIRKPIVLILQAGSERIKRFSNTQVLQLAITAHELYPDHAIIISTDRNKEESILNIKKADFVHALINKPNLNTLGALGYACGLTNGKILPTDTGPTWLTSTAYSMANPKQEFPFQILYTVANPSVWGISNAQITLSNTLKFYLQNHPEEFGIGVLSSDLYPYNQITQEDFIMYLHNLQNPPSPPFSPTQNS